MKSYQAPSSDPVNPEKFLAYMVPSLGEVDMPDIPHIIYKTACWLNFQYVDFK